MVSATTFKKIALSLPGSEESPHFEKASFRVKGKIFTTLSLEKGQATVKLSVEDQSVFMMIDPSNIYPASGSWGRQGWTVIHLQAMKKKLLNDLLVTAYCEVAPKQLTEALKKINGI